MSHPDPDILKMEEAASPECPGRAGVNWGCFRRTQTRVLSCSVASGVFDSVA